MTAQQERPWNPFYAALLDENEEALRKRERRPCVYCGKPTTALSRVCLDHDDLPVLDPQ